VELSRKTGGFKLLLVAVLCGVLIAAVRPRVAQMAAKVKERDTSYKLPPTAMLLVASLGHRAALADLIWAHVLVTQGIRASEKRPFDHLDKLLEAVSALDPKFRAPYKYGDSLLTWQVNDPDPQGSMRAARVVLERGLKEFPADAELWMNYGEFLAYVAPGALPDPKEQEQWRSDGAAALMQAGRLGSKDDNLMWHALAAVSFLDKDRERAAIINFLERVYAMTEDEELREKVLAKLRALTLSQQESRLVRQQKAFDAEWRKLPLVGRTQFRVLGPPRDTWSCAGPAADEQAADLCVRDWTAWGRSVEQVR
jgi:hypothetical protein